VNDKISCLAVYFLDPESPIATKLVVIVVVVVVSTEAL